MSNLNVSTGKITGWMKRSAHVIELVIDGDEALFYVGADVNDGGDPGGRIIDVEVWGIWDAETNLPAPPEVYDNHEDEIIDAVLIGEGIQTRSRPLY